MLIDASRPVRTGTPVWPGDAPCCTCWTMTIAEGSSVNVSELRMSAHTGTHADGPFHVDERGPRIGFAPIEAYVGPAVVADARGREMLDEPLVADLLARYPNPQRVLFRTGAWTSEDVFPTEFPAFTPVAARLLAEAGVRLVGTDAPSMDRFDSKDLPAHHVFGGAEVAILENLALDHVPDGVYELIALPLRLEEADASPVRAVLRLL